MWSMCRGVIERECKSEPCCSVVRLVPTDRKGVRRIRSTQAKKRKSFAIIRLKTDTTELWPSTTSRGGLWIGGFNFERAMARSLPTHDLRVAAWGDHGPVRQLVDLILIVAISDDASEICLDPGTDDYRMTFKVGESWFEMVPPPRQLAQAISQVFKVIADLDIADLRNIQIGPLRLTFEEETLVDTTVTIDPTAHGERVHLAFEANTVNVEVRKKLGNALASHFRQQRVADRAARSIPIHDLGEVANPDLSEARRLVDFVLLTALSRSAREVLCEPDGEHCRFVMREGDQLTALLSPPERLVPLLSEVFREIAGLNQAHPHRVQIGELDLRCGDGYAETVLSIVPTFLGDRMRVELEDIRIAREQVDELIALAQKILPTA